MAYAMEKREEIIAAHKSGMEISEISERCQVGEGTVYRLIRQEKETGEVKPRKSVGRKPALSENDIEDIRDLILSKPYITIADIKEELALTVGISAIHTVITDKLGFQKLYVLANAVDSGNVRRDIGAGYAVRKVKPVKRWRGAANNTVEIPVETGKRPSTIILRITSPASLEKEKRKIDMR